MAKKILIMAGGTGGHIFPALAVAKSLEKSEVEVVWLGSKCGMENDLVPKYGFKLHTVNAVGLRGKSLFSLIKAPFLLSLATFQTIIIINKIKPDVALGMGGFASGIGGIIAWILGVPLVIHEQNRIMGSTNRLLAKVATTVFQAFDDTFPAAKNPITSGNPILFEPQPKKPVAAKLRVLVLGGSLGAKAINEVVVGLDFASPPPLKIEIWHQTGKLHFDEIAAKSPPTTKVAAFIEDMADAYSWADVVICRAGAMTVSELMASGSASILIPLPSAIDNHQFFNAKVLSNTDAAILLPQHDLSSATLTEILQGLTPNTIAKMSANAKKLAKPDAASQIKDCIIKLAVDA